MDYSEMSLEELQAEAAGRGLPTDGDEEDLIARLEEDDADPAPGEGDNTNQEGSPPEIGYDGTHYVSVDNPPPKAVVPRP